MYIEMYGNRNVRKHASLISWYPGCQRAPQGKLAQLKVTLLFIVLKLCRPQLSYKSDSHPSLYWKCCLKITLQHETTFCPSDSQRKIQPVISMSAKITRCVLDIKHGFSLSPLFCRNHWTMQLASDSIVMCLCSYSFSCVCLLFTCSGFCSSVPAVLLFFQLQQVCKWFLQRNNNVGQRGYR